MKRAIIFAILGVFVLLSACGQSTFSVTQATPDVKGTASPAIPTETVTTPQTPVVSTSTVTPTQPLTIPTPAATPFRTAKGALVAEADLPAPEQGDLDEWDRVGTASVNIRSSLSLFYSQDDDLLIQAILKEGLTVSSLDGSNKIMLDRDENVEGPIFYYKGWIYYTKSNFPWRIKPDGSEMIQLGKTPYPNMFIYDDSVYNLGDPLIFMDLDGENARTIDLPGEDIWDIFFEDGLIYYRSDYEDEKGSVYRYNLTTGESTKIY